MQRTLQNRYRIPFHNTSPNSLTFYHFRWSDRPFAWKIDNTSQWKRVGSTFTRSSSYELQPVGIRETVGVRDDRSYVTKSVFSNARTRPVQYRSWYCYACHCSPKLQVSAERHVSRSPEISFEIVQKRHAWSIWVSEAKLAIDLTIFRTLSKVISYK